MRPRYNHLYALGFSVDSDHQEGATEGEVVRALLRSHGRGDQQLVDAPLERWHWGAILAERPTVDLPDDVP